MDSSEATGKAILTGSASPRCGAAEARHDAAVTSMKKYLIVVSSAPAHAASRGDGRRYFSSENL
jgi:hypothetical protein